MGFDLLDRATLKRPCQCSGQALVLAVGFEPTLVIRRLLTRQVQSTTMGSQQISPAYFYGAGTTRQLGNQPRRTTKDSHHENTGAIRSVSFRGRLLRQGSCNARAYRDRINLLSEIKSMATVLILRSAVCSERFILYILRIVHYLATFVKFRHAACRTTLDSLLRC
jgi:hypothetical protein